MSDTLIITGWTEDYAYAAAMALLRYPEADVDVASQKYLPTLVETLAKQRTRGRRILIMGVGLNTAPERLLAGLKKLAKQDTRIVWFSALRRPSSLPDEIDEVLLQEVGEGCLARVAGQALDVLPDDNGLGRADTRTDRIAASRILRLAEGDDLTEADQRWQELVNRGIRQFLDFKEKAPYVEVIRRLALGDLLQDDEALAEEETRALEQLRRSARPVFRAADPVTRVLKDMARRVGQSRIAPVLISGESGTGKSLLARYLHDASDRALGPYIRLDCRGLDPDWAELQLFGGEPFADAGSSTAFAAAREGTLVLHHVEALPLRLQNRLTAWLDDGGMAEADLRLVVTCGPDPIGELNGGRLLEGLWWRLRGASLRCPPLRDRPGDIGALATDTLLRLGWRRPSARQLEALQAYEWPGNVRQLQMLLEFAVFYEIGDFHRLVGDEAASFRETPVPAFGRRGRRTGYLLLPLPAPDMRTVRAVYADEVLHRCGGNKRRTAETLSISVNTLAKYLDDAASIRSQNQHHQEGEQ